MTVVVLCVNSPLHRSASSDAARGSTPPTDSVGARHRYHPVPPLDPAVHRGCRPQKVARAAQADAGGSMAEVADAAGSHPQ